jgi:hypothetical protein
VDGGQLIRLQCLPDLLHLTKRSGVECRVFKVKAVEDIDEHSGDHQPREPFVIGRDHVPRCFRRAGVADHILIGVHVAVPQLALGHIVCGELPALDRLVQPCEQSALLLLFGDAQVELDHHGPAAREMSLERVDIFETLLPDRPESA